MNELHDKPIEELDLTIRTYNVMKRADIKTIGDIVSNESELRAKSPKALAEALAKIEALKDSASDDVPEEETTSENHITYIDVKKIDPHPHNPRKDVGDVTELANSIKQNGIMQNLTVVPWFSSTSGQPADDDSMDGYYRVLIGHRRLAAAKQAGLEKVPCVIAKRLSMKEQVAIMLAENMQRADLTVFEQAEGIQMMLDLGDTVSSVSQKTGLSENTIRRRARLMDYDHAAVKDSFERGATLADYEKLENIKDPAKRAELIKEIGTNNFNWKVNQAIESEKRWAFREDVIKMLDAFAERIDSADWDKMTSCQSWFYSSVANNTVAEVENYDASKKYFYTVPAGEYGSIMLYVEKEDTPEEQAKVTKRTKEMAAKTELDERRNKLKEITNQMAKRRIQFMQDFKSFPSQKTTDILEKMYSIGSILLIDSCESYLGSTLEFCAEFLGFSEEDYENDGRPESEILAEMVEKKQLTDMQKFVYFAYFSLETDSNVYSYQNCQYIKDLDYISLYDFLEICGYVISDEERAIIDGTHELYVKEDKT